MDAEHSANKEVLMHYHCGVCLQWWSISQKDPHAEQKDMWCPHCGSFGMVKLLEEE